MEYLKLMKQALDSFERNLADDTIRINGFNNGLEKLRGEHGDLKAEVDGLQETKKELERTLIDDKREFEIECEGIQNSANEQLAKAHALVETAKRERGQAKALLAEAEQESGKVNSLRDAWSKKTKDLAEVMGN